MPRLSFHPRYPIADILTLLLAITWASVVLLTNNHYRHSPSAEESLIAKHLARGEGFLSPMSSSPSAEPTSWSPPVYPYIEAAAFRLFGIDTLNATIALATLNAISFGIIAMCARRIAMITVSEIFADEQSVCARRAGIAAVTILCAHPVLMRFVYDYWDGEIALAIFMISLALASQLGQQRLRASRSAILGALLGLLSLVNAAYIFAYPAILLFAVRRTLAREKLRPIAIALITVLFTLIPWTARNYYEYGRLLYVRGGAQLELWNGNRPDSTGWLSQETLSMHPFKNGDERGHLIQIGEMRYFDFCGQRFRDDLNADPQHFLTLTFRRLYWLFLGDPGTHGWISSDINFGLLTIDSLILAITTVLGILAAPFFVRRNKTTLWLLVIAVFSVAPFIITSSADRYALPLRTLLCILSAITLTSARARYASPTPPAAPPNSTPRHPAR